MRIQRLLIPVLLTVIASMVQPLSAQTEAGQASGWAVAAEVHGALYIPIRNLGLILSSESAQFTIDSDLSPYFEGGALIRTPFPKVSIRAMVGYTPFSTTAVPSNCVVLTGSVCTGVSADASTLNFLGEVVLHPEDLNVKRGALVAKLEGVGPAGCLAVIEQLEARGGNDV